MTNPFEKPEEAEVHNVVDPHEEGCTYEEALQDEQERRQPVEKGNYDVGLSVEDHIKDATGEAFNVLTFTIVKAYEEENKIFEGKTLDFNRIYLPKAFPRHNKDGGAFWAAGKAAEYAKAAKQQLKDGDGAPLDIWTGNAPDFSLLDEKVLKLHLSFSTNKNNPEGDSFFNVKAPWLV